MRACAASCISSCCVCLVIVWSSSVPPSLVAYRDKMSLFRSLASSFRFLWSCFARPDHGFAHVHHLNCLLLETEVEREKPDLLGEVEDDLVVVVAELRCGGH